MNKDFVFFNKILFWFIIIYLFITLNDNTIFLDKEVNVTVGEVKFVVTGEYIERVITQFGNVSAFVVGAKIAAGFLAKHPISFSGKVGGSLLTGGISSLGFQMVSMANGSIRGNIAAKERSNDTFVLELKNVEVSNSNNSSSLFTKLSDDFINSDSIKPSFNGFKLNNSFENSFVPTPEGIKTVSELIKDQNLADNFFKQSIKLSDDSDLIFINSPLEPSYMLQVQQELFTILSYNLIINLTMIYLLMLLT